MWDVCMCVSKCICAYVRRHTPSENIACVRPCTHMHGATSFCAKAIAQEWKEEKARSENMGGERLCGLAPGCGCDEADATSGSRWNASGTRTKNVRPALDENFNELNILCHRGPDCQASETRSRHSSKVVDHSAYKEGVSRARMCMCMYTNLPTDDVLTARQWSSGNACTCAFAYRYVSTYMVCKHNPPSFLYLEASICSWLSIPAKSQCLDYTTRNMSRCRWVCYVNHLVGAHKAVRVTFQDTCHHDYVLLVWIRFVSCFMLMPMLSRQQCIIMAE